MTVCIAALYLAFCYVANFEQERYPSTTYLEEKLKWDMARDSRPVDAILLGDSRGNTAFDSKYMTRLSMLNLAVNSGSILDAHQLLQQYLRHHPLPRYVILSFSEESLRKFGYEFVGKTGRGVLYAKDEAVRILREAKSLSGSVDYDKTVKNLLFWPEVQLGLWRLDCRNFSWKFRQIAEQILMSKFSRENKIEQVHRMWPGGRKNLLSRMPVHEAFTSGNGIEPFKENVHNTLYLARIKEASGTAAVLYVEPPINRATAGVRNRDLTKDMVTYMNGLGIRALRCGWVVPDSYFFDRGGHFGNGIKEMTAILENDLLSGRQMHADRH